MIESKITLKLTKNNRDYIFMMDPSSPLGEIFDVITEMRSDILQRLQKSCEEKQESCCEEVCSA